MKKIIIYSLFVLAVLSCDKADMAIDNGGLISTGTGGSTAKFTVKNDNLYALDGKNLLTYDVTQSPKLLSNVPVVREGLETIFTFKNNNSLICRRL